MSHHKVTNNNDIPKFDDLYFNVWKHQLSFIMKAKTFMTIMEGLKKKLVASTITSIQPLPFIGRGSFVEWEIEMHWHYLSSLTTLIIQWYFIFNQIKTFMKHRRNQMQVV